MSFRFNAEAFKDNSFNDKIREKLTKALNSSSGNGSSGPSPTIVESQGCDGVAAATASGTSSSLSKSSAKIDPMMKSKRSDILKSGITVSKVNFPTMPKVEILDLDISAQPRSLVKGICKISCMNAMLQVQTEIEGNLLLVYSDYSPQFTTPTLNCKDSFTIPITMVFSEVHLEAITNIFVKNSGIGISFNDVNLDFKFDCSIKILQSTIEKRLKKSMQSLFKDVLPRVIFNMSQSLFTAETATKTSEAPSTEDNEDTSSLTMKVMLEEADLQELSAANMLRLSTLISSRQTLSLQDTVLNVPSTIPGCLERQNLHRFNSRIPSLSNFYASYKEPEGRATLMKRNTSTFMVNSHPSSTDQNVLPQRVLEEDAYDLKEITTIQSRIFERSTDENVRPRRRKISIKRKPKKIVEAAPPVETHSDSETAVASPKPIKATHNALPIEEHQPSAFVPMKLPVNITPRYFTQPERTLLPLENRHEETKPTTLEEINYFNYRPEVHRLRSSLYSPLAKGGSILMPGRDLAEPRPLLENKGLSFLGLNHRMRKWGNHDDPPPYQV